MHLQSKPDLQSEVRVKINEIWYILLSIRLPFGVTSCPQYLCLMSDIICDTNFDFRLYDDCDETKVFLEFSNFVPSEK